MFKLNISLSCKFLVAALLCLAPAQAQMSLTGAGGEKGAAAVVGPPTLTFQDRATQNTGSGTTWTSNSVNVGTAFANRRVYMIVMEGDPGNSIVSATIGGVACDVAVTIGNSGTSNNFSFYVISAVVPTGTTTTATINLTNTLFSTTLFYVWTTDTTTLVSPTPTATSYVVESVAGTSLTGSVATSAGSAILMGFGGFGFTSGTQNISASDSGMSPATAFGAMIGGTSNNVLTSAANHVTVSWTPSAAGSSMGLVALR